MRRKLLISVIGSYLVFLLSSYLIVMYSLPFFLEQNLHSIMTDAQVNQYMHNQTEAVQDVCYLLIIIIFVLSLFPIVVVHYKIYMPLQDIIIAASNYMESHEHPKLSYAEDDELGRLAGTLNYLMETDHSSEKYQHRIVSDISHDFRSPLTSIRGYVEAILDGTIPPEQQERYLNIVLSETDRLTKLTESILLLERFDDNTMYLELSDFDLIKVVHQTFDVFEGICAKKHLTLRLDAPTPPVMVCADLTRIQQVLYNLIDNAIKFSPPDKEILLTISERKNLVFVSVKDKGMGIEKDSLLKIWDRFYKTDASRGRHKQGVGLGLSIVKEIITAHGQNISVVSTEGVGTEFVFTLSPSTPHRHLHAGAAHHMEKYQRNIETKN